MGALLSNQKKNEKKFLQYAVCAALYLCKNLKNKESRAAHFNLIMIKAS